MVAPKMIGGQEQAKEPPLEGRPQQALILSTAILKENEKGPNQTGLGPDTSRVQLK
jgi:hypothetical protein